MQPIMITKTSGIKPALIAAANKCGIVGPFSDEGNGALSGFLYADANQQMACPVDFAPWSDTSHATQLLAALNGTVKYDGVHVSVTVTRFDESTYVEATADADKPAAKTRAFRAALQAVVETLYDTGKL